MNCHTHISEALLLLTTRACLQVGWRSVTPQLMSDSIDSFSYLYIYCLFVCLFLLVLLHHTHPHTHAHRRIIAICSPPRQSRPIIVKVLVKTLPDSINVPLLAGTTRAVGLINSLLVNAANEKKWCWRRNVCNTCWRSFRDEFSISSAIDSYEQLTCWGALSNSKLRFASRATSGSKCVITAACCLYG